MGCVGASLGEGKRGIQVSETCPKVTQTPPPSPWGLCTSIQIRPFYYKLHCRKNLLPRLRPNVFMASDGVTTSVDSARTGIVEGGVLPLAVF